ncbi:family 43 glycosylhydrolase [Aureibacillus halotolerans]|uniref:GH43 family beta-xylosidase n=1 Tax=Aureibacillus halotolerans TaxID=1508390 RepID=A0A4R6U537_9BACI|nr:family 43 glycosylhydrolase [Aureibacillus halotolerans]TDQ40846.1 GH43 family beta-xylosidase [Aureibacillus halotolerans]
MANKKFHILLFCLATMLMFPQKSSAEQPAPANPKSNAVTDFYNVIFQNGGDPWVYKHTDGYYYYTHTTGGNVTVWRSKTITGIDASDKAVAWTPPKNTMYSSNIWAPEIHYLDGKWYIYFAADDGNNANHRMYVLENASSNPLTGTWEFKGQITDPSDRWAIDGTVLEINDERYFVWSGWEETDGSFQNIYIARMSNPWTISSERVLISTPTHDWETSPARINEGPQFTIRGNMINLVYSANGSWTDSYCLGLITADLGADLLDPNSWVKKDEPIFSSANGIYGPGHHSFTTSPDGSEDWILYHAARWQGSGWTRSIRTQEFTWNADGTPNLGMPVDQNTPIALPSGELKRKRYEAEHALLVKDPESGTGPSVRWESSASSEMKVANINNDNDYAQFKINVPTAGSYSLFVRTANGSAGGGTANHILSVNGGPGSKLNVVFSGWNHWGVSTATVFLEKGDNTVRFTKGDKYAEIDSMDVVGPVEGLEFRAPVYTLGLNETLSLLPLMETVKSAADGVSVRPISEGVSFSVSPGNKVVEVTDTETGTIKAIGLGSTVITATYGDYIATTTVTVDAEPASVQSIAISGLDNVIVSGEQEQQLQLSALYSNYEVHDVTDDATYSSSNTDVATVTPTGQVHAVQPGETVINATYGGKEVEFSLVVAEDPDASSIQVFPLSRETPSGVTPVLPNKVPVVHKGEEKGVAEVNWKLQGLDFNSLGTVQATGILEDSGIPLTASVRVAPGWGLDEIVNNARSRIDDFSIPIGKGLGNYSQWAYDDLMGELDHLEELSAAPDLSKKQFEKAQNRLAEAEAELLDSLNLTEDGVTYNAYRNFSDDETGKYPYGIAIEALTNGATATVQEEEGNKFLRLTTTANSGKANLFLPYAGEVKAEAGQSIVIEYKARVNSEFGYANGAMVRNDSGNDNYSMVTAFDRGNIIAQDGGSKKPVQKVSYDTWYTIKMVANWDAKTYAVYLNDEPVPVATDFVFRHTGGSMLTGQRFGIDGFANASIDFDDFKVRITDGP